MENKSTIESVNALRTYVESTIENLKGNSTGWVSVYDSDKLAKLMTFFEGNQKQYVVFGALTSDGKLDLLPHEKVFWFSNDLIALKLLANEKYKSNPQDYSAEIQDYSLRIYLNAIFIQEYLISLEENIVAENLEAIMMKKPNTSKNIYENRQRSYLDKINNLANKNEYNKKQVPIMGKGGAVINIPLSPMSIGYKLDEEADRLNVYMTKEMADQLRARLASIQADAMRPR